MLFSALTTEVSADALSAAERAKDLTQEAVCVEASTAGCAMNALYICQGRGSARFALFGTRCAGFDGSMSRCAQRAPAGSREGPSPPL